MHLITGPQSYEPPEGVSLSLKRKSKKDTEWYNLLFTFFYKNKEEEMNHGQTESKMIFISSALCQNAELCCEKNTNEITHRDQNK